MITSSKDISRLLFAEAASEWLETRKPYINPRTVKNYEERLRVMAQFFGRMHLPDITPDLIRAYQKMRLIRVGASAINHECSLLQMMLKRIGCWSAIADDYDPLPLPKESPHRALTPQEEERLYRIGATNPAWDVAYCAYVISINTTCGPGEIRHLRHMDIDHERQTMRVQPEGAKNEHRIRIVPLNQTAWRAIEYLLARAARIGSVRPEHYVIPFRLKKCTYDPNRPAKGWRTAFREMCVAAGIEISPYCLRHHSITKLLENPEVSEETAEAIAGHISHRMKRRYSHIRLEVKRAAIEALDRIHQEPPLSRPKRRRAQAQVLSIATRRTLLLNP